MQHENATLVETEQRMEAEPQASTGQQDSMPCLEPAIFRIDGHDVHGARKDPVGLVGCCVMIVFDGWPRSYGCTVEAFAREAPGGPAYVISWKSTGEWDDGQCLYSQQAMIGVTGLTFPFKDELKAKGFTFTNEVNGEEGVQMWLAPQDDVDAEELIALFDDYGFAVETFDGVEEE